MSEAIAPTEGRTYTLQVRLTETEKTALTTAAQQCGMSMSDYVRTRILGRRIQPRTSQPAAGYQAMEPRLFAHLSRIGNNLNQIAHAFNERGFFEQREAIDAVREVWEIMLEDEVTARHAVAAEGKYRAGRRTLRQ